MIFKTKTGPIQTIQIYLIFKKKNAFLVLNKELALLGS